MPTARTLRLNELLQRELSGLLHREHQTEAVTITVTSMDMAPDLRSCKVFVAVTGDDDHAENRFRWLRRHAGAFRATLSHRVVLKHLPALTFIADTATPRGNRILAVLDEIAAREKSAPPTADEPGGEPPSSPAEADEPEQTNPDVPASDSEASADEPDDQPTPKRAKLKRAKGNAPAPFDAAAETDDVPPPRSRSARPASPARPPRAQRPSKP